MLKSWFQWKLYPFPVTQPTWLPGPFLLFHGIALCLLLSWVFPPVRALWDTLDMAVFTTLNSLIPVFSIEANRILAMMCHQKFDVIMALAIVTLAFIPGVCFPKGQSRYYTLLLFFVFGTIVTLAGYNLGVFHRLSPSLVVDGVNALPDVGFVTKTSSHDSFPGNHSMVLMAWLLYIWLFSHRKTLKWLVLGMVILLMAPRMTVGAHWLTDNLVGGGSFALVFMAWTCFTPLRMIPYAVGNLLETLAKRLSPFTIRKQALDKSVG